jgi:hypothetical protein
MRSLCPGAPVCTANWVTGEGVNLARPTFNKKGITQDVIPFLFKQLEYRKITTF